MNKLLFLRSLMDAMESEMADLGFKKSFSRQKFIKEKDENFIVAYSLSVLQQFNLKLNKSGIVIEPALYIHNYPVESIYSKITIRQLNNVQDLKTIGNLLAAIIANPTGEYKIYNQSLNLYNYDESDMLNSSATLINYFKKVALPYFENNATWAGLDSIFNANLDIPSVHCNNESERSIRGLIVAKLIDRPDFDKLLNIHEKKIMELGNNNTRLEFDRLCSMLPSIGKLKIV